jgi:hypothetical protein
MKRTLIILLFIVLVLPSCIKEDHIGRRYDMDGYASRMVGLYYTDVISRYKWGESADGYSYTQLDEHTWQCLVIEEKHEKDEEHNRACPVSARVLVTVTESNDSQTVVIDGYRYEDDYTTRVFTLGDGIVNKRGVIRVEVYRADYLAGWREVNIER